MIQRLPADEPRVVRLGTLFAPAEVMASPVIGIDPEQERARAYELARSRYPHVMGLPYATQVRRLMGALTRRGYDAGLASAVVRDVVSSDSGEMPVV